MNNKELCDAISALPLPEPWIRDCTTKDPAARDHFATDQVRELLSEAAALAEQVQGQHWISVEDRLPETFVYDDTPCKLDGKEIPPAIRSLRVIVALDDGVVREDRLEGLQGNPPYWQAFGERVFAWQPMPAAPSIAQDGLKSEGA